MPHWPISRRDEHLEIVTPAGSVHAVVRRLAFRVHLGPVRWEIGRLRARQVGWPDGNPAAVPVPVPPEPWSVVLGGVLLVWLGCAALLAAQRRKEHARGAPRIPSA